jgi:hypothetical protein
MEDRNGQKASRMESDGQFTWTGMFYDKQGLVADKWTGFKKIKRDWLVWIRMEKGIGWYG